MTKPIEWRREIKSTETTIIRTRIAVQELDRYGSTIAVFAATPADLVAALAAMGEGERAEVLREFDASQRPVPSWLSDAAEALGEVRPEDGAPLALNWTQVVRAIYDQRAERDDWRASAEKAEAEITEVRRVLGVRENAVTASTAAWRMGEIRAATVRAEKAERERDRMAAEFGCCPGEIPDDGEIARVVRERAEFRDRAEKAERERDEARKELDRVRASLDVVRHDLDGTRQELGEARDKLAVRGVTADAFRAATDSAEAALRAERTACARAEKAERELERVRTRLGAVPAEDAFDAARRVVAERDSLRTRLIAAESALATREPREYPLAEGSRWDGDEIVDLDGTRTSAVGRTGWAHIWCVGPWGEKRFPRIENVLALAHRRGMA